MEDNNNLRGMVQEIPLKVKIDYLGQASISYFTMQFADTVREKMMILSSDYFKNAENRQAFIQLLKDCPPDQLISNISMALEVFVNNRVGHLNPTALVLIFDRLFSEDSINLLQRAQLISTLRVIIDRISNRLKESHLLSMVEETYDLYCEAASFSGTRINFKSGNYLGALVSPELFFWQVEDSDCDQYVPPKGQILLECDNRIPFDWAGYGLKNISDRITFLHKVYYDLMTHPECSTIYSPSGGVTYLTDLGTGMAYPKESNFNNFIRMFEGTDNETDKDKRPVRVELNGERYRLSNFIDAMELQHGARWKAEKALRKLIVLKDVYLGETTFQTDNRHQELREIYKQIFKNAKY